MYLENRMIAMLDVLGLSNQIKNKKELLSTVETYKKLILEAQKAVFRTDTLEGSLDSEVINFEVGEFVFDTVVLVSPPVNVHAACKFILAAVRLMELFAKHEMPLRGAIGIGDYCTDEDTTVFLSNIFKQLSNEEKNQQWSGCVLTPESEDEVLSLVVGSYSGKPKKSDIFHKLQVPSKSEDKIVRWCLNWIYQIEPSHMESVLNYMEDDKSKLEGTKAYIELVNSLPDDAQDLQEKFLPAVRLKTIKTRASMNLRFENQNGCAVYPGCDEWTLTVLTPK